jgi:hypothetical protein
MRRTRTLAFAVAATAATALAVTFTQPGAAFANQASTSAGQAPLTPAEASALSADVNTPVIVLMKNQPTPAATNAPAATSRANQINGLQAPLLNELTQVHAQHVQAYHVADAVSATVSKDEAARLAANPAVQAVVPDSVVKGPDPVTDAGSASGTGQSGGAGSATSGVCPAPGKVMLEPEALSDTHTDSDDPNAKTAHGLGYTGTGVKVAYLAEGIDINNPDFIRADGSHVFAGYQDFSGDGPNAPTSGGEAFLDASAIAAQGRQVYDVSHFSAHPLPTPCDIRILGTAPGASLYGFKVYGQNNYSTTSAILQGIDYAVNTDHVDVINESFGYNPFPDNGSADAVRLFDDAAADAGVTVSVSSGDAGTTSTQGSPTTDPKVLSVGASTTFRWYAQTDYGAYQQFAKNGWLNDNVSSLSSSGFDQQGRTVDLLAPGDSSFALCTPSATYADCADLTGKPSSVERSGGTSESSPLTAGVAALVIQAYRQSHNGASPAPALVKQIITSSTDDLTEPGDEQGTGLLDGYQAVLAAKSVHDANGAPAATGSALLVNSDQLTGSGSVNSKQSWQVKVTNTGAGPQTVDLSGRSFGPAQHDQTGSVTLDDKASQHFADWAGNSNNYGSVTFTVPANADRLSASIAYPGNPAAALSARVRMILIDPQGRYAAHSLPQGVGNYGNVDVRFPAAGTWTAIIFSPVTKSGGTAGKVLFDANTANTTTFGSVSPSSLKLAPGQTGTVTVTANTPAAPGDGSGSLVLHSSSGHQSSVPIQLRSLIDPAHGGAFSGTLTGGNGRQPDLGQENYYNFDVPAGQHDIDASVDLKNDAGDNLVAYLIDPQGNAVATGVNRLATAYDPSTRSGTFQQLTQADVYTRDPMPGRWTLAVNFAGAIVGDELSQPFTGHVTFNKVDVKLAGLPNTAHTALPAAKAATMQVAVHNTGTEPEDVFLDPRLDGPAQVKLAAAEPASIAMPMSASASSPAWLVPSETTGVALTASASVPVMFDFGPEAGDPDLPSIVTGKTAIGVAHGNPLPQGVWAADPSELGASGPKGAPAGTISMNMVASTKAFDPSVTSTATDFWQSAVTPATSLNLVTVNPGQTVNIPVTITPAGPKGTVVHGTVYVDNLVVGATPQLNALNFSDGADTEPSANELTALPYQYTIG